MLAKLYLWLPFVWTALIVATAVNIGSNPIGAALQRPGMAFLVGGGLLVLALLTFFARDAAQAEARQTEERLRRSEFALLATTSRLQPEDFHFKRAQLGMQVDGTQRPYYSTYMSRVAVSYTERHSLDSAPTYDEAALVHLVTAGHGFLLIGQPTEGKTRTMFEIISHVSDRTVVTPHRDHIPSEAAFSLLDGHDVICVVDDLNEFLTASLDLWEFCNRLGRRTRRYTLVAACRDGGELSELMTSTASSLRRVYESFHLTLALRGPTGAQKEELVTAVGAETGRAFPTLGAICMSQAFMWMRQRFDGLPARSRDCFRAIQLLAAGGVEPFTHERIQAVLKDVFHITADKGSVRQELNRLVERFPDVGRRR